MRVGYFSPRGQRNLTVKRSPGTREFAVIDYKGMTPSSNPGIVTLKKRTLSPAALRLIEEVIAVTEHP
jgi:hypothetical protein